MGKRKKALWLACLLLALWLPAVRAEERTFQVSPQAALNEKGEAVVTWEDSGDGGPYAVLFEYAGESAVRQTRWMEKREIAEKTCAIRGLIPGKTYRVFVEDRDGETAEGLVTLPEAGKYETTRRYHLVLAQRYKPDAGIADANAKQFRTMSAKAMTENMRAGFRYGMDFRVQFKNKGQERTVHHAVFAFYAPNGYVETDFAEDFVFPREAEEASCHYYFIGGVFFDRLLAVSDAIPAGQYRFEVYVDGAFFGEEKFTVAP